MLFRPLPQEAQFAILALCVIAIIFVGVGGIVGWRYRKQGIGGIAPRVIATALAGIPLGIFVVTPIISPGYEYPGSFFISGIALTVGTIFIAAGNMVAERIRTDNHIKEQTARLKGTSWVIANAIAAVVSAYILVQMGSDFIPIVWFAVVFVQWRLLRQIFPISSWWLLGTLFASFGYFAGLAGYLLVGHHIGGLLLAGLQWFLLRPYSRTGAVWLAGATLIGWIIFGTVPGGGYSRLAPSALFSPFILYPAISFYGMVIIWSSLLVAPIAGQISRPMPDTKSAEDYPISPVGETF